MTTVVYHKESGVVAVDSLSTRNGIIIDRGADKSQRLEDGALMIFCGAPADYKYLVDAYSGKQSSLNNPDALAFLLKGGLIYRCAISDGEYWQEEVVSNDAHGSGAEFALAAMDFGKGAVEAVEYAMTRDTRTGGLIKTFSVINF